MENVRIQVSKELSVVYGTEIKEMTIALPSAIEFKPAVIGRGVFAKRDFKAGEVMYDAVSILIPNREATIQLTVRSQDEETKEATDLVLNTFTHAVEWSESIRELFPYDSFMNHSCVANSYMRYTGSLDLPIVHPVAGDTGKELMCISYQMVTHRAIRAGEEITCNYNTFDYRCHGHEIAQCFCGAEHCCGRVGFAYLPLSEQLAMLPEVSEVVKQRFYQDHPSLAISAASSVFNTKDGFVLRERDSEELVSDSSLSDGGTLE